MSGRVRRPVCPCEYCDPLLWSQAQSSMRAPEANILGLLAELVRDACHPEQRDERKEEEAKP